MMMARKSTISQWRFLTALALLSSVPAASFAQGYSNPHYQGSRKGQAAEVPSYSSPSLSPSTRDASGRSSPTYDYGNSSHSGSSMKLGVNVGIPLAVGDAGQGLKSKFGGDVQLYLNPLISEDFQNYFSVGYQSFSLKADADAKFHLIPFSFGLELPMQTEKTLSPAFGVALGGAYGFIGVPDSQTFTGRAYFLAQVRPGLDINFGDFVLTLRMPVTFLISNSRMTYLAYNVGVRLGL